MLKARLGHRPKPCLKKYILKVEEKSEIKDGIQPFLHSCFCFQTFVLAGSATKLTQGKVIWKEETSVEKMDFIRSCCGQGSL